MATQSIADAVVYPQDPGTGLSSKDDRISAGLEALLADYEGGEYHRIDVSSRSASNDTITFSAGYAFVTDDSTATTNDRSSGGQAQIQSALGAGYDTELPVDNVYLVVLPTSVTVDVSDSTANTVWLNVTSVSSQNSVELRSDGGGGTTSTPSDTYLKLGEFNPDDASADTYYNRAGDGELETYSENAVAEAGDVHPVTSYSLADDETIEVRHASLLNGNLSAAPTNLDLVLATTPNDGTSTRQSILVDGDGTVKADEEGDPIATYTNATGSSQTVYVGVDNGEFNSGTGSNQTFAATVTLG